MHGFHAISLITHFYKSSQLWPEDGRDPLNYGLDKVCILQPIVIGEGIKLRSHILLDAQPKTAGDMLLKTRHDIEVRSGRFRRLRGVSDLLARSLSSFNETPEQLQRPDSAVSTGRLQRPAAKDGTHISTFRQVCRHGVTMGLCALAGLFLPLALERIQARHQAP